MADETPLDLEPAQSSRYDPALDAAAQIAEERREQLEAQAREIERAARRRTLLIGAGVVAAVLVLSLAVAVFTTRRTPGTSGRATDDAFSAEGLAVPGAVSAQFSPDGNRLAVLRGGGAFGLSEAGRFRSLVPPETAISAFAWYDGGRLLVQEGPISTGQLVALDLEGGSKGVVKLDPDVPPGTGLAVSPDRRTVVLTSSLEPGTPGSRPVVDLYVATVPGGATRRLTDDPAAESRPVFLDDQRVAFTSRVDSSEEVVVLDLQSGARTSLTTPSGRASVIGTVGADVVWTTGDEVRAGHPGSPARTVAKVPAGTVAVALSPDQKRLVVRETSPDGDTILRRVQV